MRLFLKYNNEIIKITVGSHLDTHLFEKLDYLLNLIIWGVPFQYTLKLGLQLCLCN